MTGTLPGVLAATAVWLAWRPPRRPTARRRRPQRTRPMPVGQLARLLALVQIGVAGGTSLAAAWAAALATEPQARLPGVRHAVTTGGDLAAALGQDAAGAPELALAALVARLTARTGAPPGDPMAEVTRLARDRVALDRAVAQEIAATRASVAVLAGLPLLGLALGRVLGSDAMWLLTAGLGRACLVIGVCFEVAGLLWMRRMVAAVVRQ